MVAEPDGTLLGRRFDPDTATPDALTAVDPADEAIERMTRTSPQQLFEIFNDMELAWGPTWSTR